MRSRPGSSTRPARPSGSSLRPTLAGVALALGAITASCPDDDITGDVKQDGAVTEVRFDVFVPDVPDSAVATDADAGDVDDADAGDTNVVCQVAGELGCPCTGAVDCLSGQCIEGPDGNICSRSCIEECPEGFDCVTTSAGGADPVTICVPRHARLCRPCVGQPDCQSPLDPNPAACVPAADPAEGSFCATSCAQVPCPGGYTCEDVAVGDGIARLCLPEDDTCECRPAWADLALTTACQVVNEAGACDGSRSCTADGLSDCSAATPATEACNRLDDDCDGTTDNVAAVACDNSNDFGRCPGTTACSAEGELICQAPIPAAEICNGVDDDCDSQTDEAWDNCLPSGCNEAEGVYIETGAPSCIGGECVYTNPKPCGLYACDGGGDAGDLCASACNDDTACIAAAHCDEVSGTCVPDVVDGGACGDASDCASGHCQNGFCCADGDCCNQPQDCPAAYRSGATCDVAGECQGSRRDARCVAAMCTTSEPIADDSGCGPEVLARDCTPNAPRYCSGQPSQSAPACATTCASDAECASGFHCDGTCLPDVTNGGACDEDTDCAGDYCENGFCCSGGTCCAAASDCPDSFRDPATCLDTVTCQGERIDAVCRQNTCDSVTAQDDSGCDANVEANACGPYDAVYCSGAASQGPPQCAFSCTTDDACDAGFHCDVICVVDLPDGNACDEDSDCASDHCQNGLCCATGDCCNLAGDCPADYFGAPTCDNPQTCQGTREAAVCTSHVCAKVPGAADDSACTAAVEASACGPYPSVRCAGGASQQAPVCATSCSSNAECDTASYCDPVSDKCLPKKDPGSACTDSAQCGTGHCQNGFCCGSGDCCATKADCSPAVYGTPSVCLDAATCQGERQEPACSASFQCQVGLTVGDDSACAGSESDTCGYFESVFCTAAQVQVDPACPAACSSDNQCDAGAHCEAPACVPDAGVGEVCQVNNQCGALTCIDGRCCESACAGTCRRCDDADALGICTLADEGSDPDGECGAVSCTGYYWGFDGRTCHARASLTAAAAGCDTDGTCQTPEDVCPTADKGAATTSCHATCQVPTAGTCEGTTPGACTNVTGGTQTCGVGECARTVDRCVDGALASCTPGPVAAEVCDGKDNDCDGLTDAADPDMARIACQNQNGVCAGSLRPAALCVGGAWQACGDAVYAAHNAAYQAGFETTCDGGAGVDNDCDGAVDDDFTYVGPNGAQVRGAGKSCGVGVCAGGVTQCATGNTLVCSKDNLIVAETCDAKDNDCDGTTDSLDPSLVLVACGTQAGVCQGAMTTASLCAAGQWQACGATQYEANNSLYETDETLCDGRDNDCNSQTDDGLVAPNNSNQLGACAGTKKACAGTLGWADNYGGVPGFGLDETPNGSFLDENCDGIDGDVDLGVFVTPSGSASGTCPRASPCNFTRGLAVVGASRPHMYLQAGTYAGPFTIDRTVKIYGGYDTGWVRKARGTGAAYQSRINGGAYGAAGNAVSLYVNDSVSATIADLFVQGANASGTFNGLGRSSYAIYAANGSTLTAERVDIIAGNGGAGATGSAGTNASSSQAQSGGRGTNAYTGSYTGCDQAGTGGGGGGDNSCDVSFGNPDGGGGGDGGRPDEGDGCGVFDCCCCYDATGGTNGGRAADWTGSFGINGSGGGTCSSGTGGSGGTTTDGGGGSSNGSRGYLSGGFWYAFDGDGGTLGRNGVGGGGGGGSGACNNGLTESDTSGAGGGGGGAGGCRAPAAGGGGRGGGGSFAIFGYQATLNVTQSTLTRGSGGSGGVGGGGGRGQDGGGAGGGGNGANGSQAGSTGGAGGRGGHAGAGAGGSGGVSFGVFRFGGSFVESGNTYTGGSPGSGGPGGSGTTSGQNGATGATGAGSNLGTCSASGGC